MFQNDATDLVALIETKGFVASTIQFAQDRLQAAYDLGVQSVTNPGPKLPEVPQETPADADTTAALKGKRAPKAA